MKYLYILAAFTFFLNSIKAQDNLVINEFMAVNNGTLQDEDGDYSDWIEIHNTGTSAVNLAGWVLTDEADEISKWIFPAFSLDSNEYIVVFASGKNRIAEKDKLHTNFKLSGSGEFLALIKPGGTQIATVFTPAYPEQYTDVSYGKYLDSYIYLSNPTPGAMNDSSIFLTAPDFSVNHGYYYSSFDLSLTSNIDSADIYYTTDASMPSETNGIKYSGSIPVSTTAIIRALTVKPGVGTSATKTQSYIFPDSVIRQSNHQPGYPETWLSPIHGTENYFEISASYGIQQSVVNNAVVAPVIVQSLENLPVVSIVSDIDNFFSKSTNPDSGGIYMYNGEPDGSTASLQYHLGRGWIRPGSIEYFNSDEDDGEIDFQANCGIKIHGGASRTRAKTLKHSFKIGFKSEYGKSRLKQKLFGKGSPDQYDWLILRGGFDRRLGQQVYDPWAKASMQAMGQYAAYNKFVHVYINGLYWGMYDLSEQMDESCMRDNLGGDTDDYDILKDYFEVEIGDTIAWTQLVEMAHDSVLNPDNYQKILGNNPDGTPNSSYEKLLNIENMVDYIILYMYGAPWDWDNHNWTAARRKTNTEGFHFMVWDAESFLGNVNANYFVPGNYNRPSGIFTDLYRYQECKDLFISRVNKHFFEGGALTPKPCLERYENIFHSFDTAVIADQARWVASSDIWNNGYHSFIYTYFPARTEVEFKAMISGGMYPNIGPPVFNTTETLISPDFQLTMTAPDGGEIRYTTNGIDPGYFSPVVEKSIIIYDSNSIILPNDTVIITARVKKDSLWSTSVTKQFIQVGIVAETSKTGSLRCYPNPLTDQTNIVFTLTKPSHVNIRIYSITGEYITTLKNGMLEAGEHTVTWHADNSPSGVYFGILENLTDSKRYRITVIKE